MLTKRRHIKEFGISGPAGPSGWLGVSSASALAIASALASLAPLPASAQPHPPLEQASSSSQANLAAASPIQPALTPALTVQTPSSSGQPSQASSPPSEAELPGDTPPPPPDLVVLVDKVGLKGRYRLGVYGRKPDPSQPQVWRLNLWEQTVDRLFISTDVLNCSPIQPMRITGDSGGRNGSIILRELNPGGLITPSNRLDHQIWWAACFPEYAGKDPATLAPQARRLGYSGSLVEREQVVPGGRRP